MQNDSHFIRDAGFEEAEPTVHQAIKDLRPSGRACVSYFKRLLPSTNWVPRYNLRWLLGDGIAGVTVGLVVIPQAMAYAQLAGLSPDFGLYTSFVGAASYWLFGTPKDVVIGVTKLRNRSKGRSTDIFLDYRSWVVACWQSHRSRTTFSTWCVSRL